jgi:HlyD family secretion protein
MNKKIVIVCILAAGIGAAMLWKLAPCLGPRPYDSTLFASGTMDPTEIAASIHVPGILRNRTVEEGSHLKDLEQGSHPQEVAVARAIRH